MRFYEQDWSRIYLAAIAAISESDLDASSEHARRKITRDHAVKLFKYDLSAN
jgi:hypothetical protein